MHLSATDLWSICDRASNLSERLSGQYGPTGENSGAAARRLERWRQLAKQSMPHQLASLSLGASPEAISEERLLALLGPVRRTAGTPVPAWASLLDEIVGSLVRSFHPGTKNGGPITHVPPKKFGIPFEHLYWPIAEFAWARIGLSSGSTAQIALRARLSLQKQLMQRLSGVASPLLHAAFLARRAVEQSETLRHSFGVSATEAGQAPGARQYERFVTEQGQAGLQPFFLRHPAAARLVAEVAGLWIEATREFLGRLSDDQNFLAAEFNDGVPLGALSDVTANLSDPHQGGRSVMILRFAAGVRVVYKPRPMRVDVVFSELIRELNDHCPDLELGALRAIDRDDYGWMEFARHAPCPNVSAAKRYYVRAGALVYLVHWLGGIDFHRENVVATGEHPMLVDLESLAHPLRSEESALIQTGVGITLAASILRTGLLPLRQLRYQEATPYDNSGLDGPVSQRSLLPALRWHEVNSDRMRSVYRIWRDRHAAHRPTMNHRVLTMRSFEREMITGLRRVADAIRGSFTDRFRVLRDTMFRQSRRRIKRATIVYAVLLRSSLDPARLGEGVDRSIELMSLPCQVDGDWDWLSEISDLERLDIPYFLESREPRTEADRADLMPPPVAELGHDVRTVRRSIRRQLHLHEGRLLFRSPSNWARRRATARIKAAR